MADTQEYADPEELDSLQTIKPEGEGMADKPLVAPEPNLTPKEMMIPDLLRVGEIQSDMMAHIDTNIHEPVIFTDSFIRFQLDNQGFLNPYSRLCFALKNDDSTGVGDASRLTLPANVGTGALFERVTLKIGGKTICEVEDFGHFHAWKSTFIAGEINKERECVLSGRRISHGQVYGNASATLYDDTTSNERFKGNVAWKSGQDSNREYNEDNLQANDWALINREPTFSITLEELLPVFRRTAMPLYMLNKDQSVQIELVLASNEKRYSRADGTGAKTLSVDRSSCKIIADYTTYDQPIMDSYREQNKNISYTFLDYQLTKMSLTKDTAQNVVRNIGGAGRVVPRLFCMIADNDLGSTSFMNEYSAIAPAVVGGSTAGQLTTNIKKNDKFLYPIDRSNSALHFHSVKDAEGMLPFVSRDEYSGQGEGITTFDVEGETQQTELQGQFFRNGYKMVDGERVGTRGLEIHSKYLDLPAGTNYLFRGYVEAVKVAVMDGGRFDCYYA